jgi:aspartate aminotransferase
MRWSREGIHEIYFDSRDDGVSQSGRGFLRKRFDASISPTEIAASCGGKQALFNAACCLLNPGDDVLIPKPYWVTFPAIAAFCGANSVFIETEETDFILTADQVKDAIAEKTKAPDPELAE